ncbi:hypothetical protein DRQ16_04085 [bacterium]|nr:MAG: hypothetical protein DRQ16_04085 [bacterium]
MFASNLLNIFRKPKVGIALAGGSAKGLAHIGILEVLEREGLKISTVAGTSIGAIVGGLYALNPSASFLYEKARELVNSEAYRDLHLDRFSREEGGGWFASLKKKMKETALLAEMFRKRSLIPQEPTERVFKEIFGEAEFKDTKLPFAAVALDLITGKDVIITEGALWKAAMASAAIPGVFPPVEWDGMLLVDGGVTANVPIEAAFKLGSQRIIASVLGKEPSKPGNLNSAISIFLRVDELAKLKLFRMLLEKAHCVVDIETEDIHWTDFGRIEECVERGRRAAEKSLKKIRRMWSRI